ncbi:hypothetical protein KSP40_PGU012432 [Platanthera guangdongensis]|uniref:Uncharacterized protein n=1 Tax=Platanthera guangdongensis TaxID=2320717 RepID=A0ABR2MBY6_9ASPA
MEDLRVDEGPEIDERITSTSTDSFAIKAAESTSSQDYKELEILPEMGSCYVEEHRHCQISVLGRFCLLASSLYLLIFRFRNRLMIHARCF